MEPPVLTDSSTYPTEEIIFSHIGRAKTRWQSLFGHIDDHHPDLSEEWRYYKDGKSWLLKVTRKKKTICWVSVIKGAFRMTFYFTDRAEEAIQEMPISEALKEQFRTGKYYNKIRGLTITFRNKKAIADAKALIVLKLSIK